MLPYRSVRSSHWKTNFVVQAVHVDLVALSCAATPKVTLKSNGSVAKRKSPFGRYLSCSLAMASLKMQMLISQKDES